MAGSVGLTISTMHTLYPSLITHIYEARGQQRGQLVSPFLFQPLAHFLFVMIPALHPGMQLLSVTELWPTLLNIIDSLPTIQLYEFMIADKGPHAPNI